MPEFERVSLADLPRENRPEPRGDLWAGVARAARAAQGDYVKVTGETPAFASAISRGKLVAFQPAGDFECVTRNTRKSDADKRIADLYVRFVGSIPTEKDEAGGEVSSREIVAEKVPNRAPAKRTGKKSPASDDETKGCAGRGVAPLSTSVTDPSRGECSVCGAEVKLRERDGAVMYHRAGGHS